MAPPPADLLTLPLELRNQIYTDLLTPLRSLFLPPDSLRIPTNLAYVTPAFISRTLGSFPTTTPQIQREVTALFCSVYLPHLYFQFNSLDSFWLFAESVGPQYRQNIRGLLRLHAPGLVQQCLEIVAKAEGYQSATELAGHAAHHEDVPHTPQDEGVGGNGRLRTITCWYGEKGAMVQDAGETEEKYEWRARVQWRNDQRCFGCTIHSGSEGFGQRIDFEGDIGRLPFLDDLFAAAPSRA
jgi:hypothetical protein